MTGELSALFGGVARVGFRLRSPAPILSKRVIAVGLALAISSFSTQSVVQAQGHLQNWNTGQRERSQRLLSAAMTALNKNQLAQAVELLIQATQADPTDAAPFSELGIIYVRQGKFPEALDALKKSYHISKLAETLLSTGFTYYLQHDYDASIASWKKALEHDPKMVEVNADIGFAYMRKGDFAKSDQSFRDLIKYRPSSQLAYQGLAVLNYLAGHFSAARRAAEHAQSIQSYYPVLLLLAKLDFLQGDPKSGQKRVAEWQRAAKGKRSLLRSMTALGYPTQHDFHWDPFIADNFDNGRVLIARNPHEKNGDESTHKNESRRNIASKSGKGRDLLSRAKQAQFACSQDFYITRELALIEMAYGDCTSASEHFNQVMQLCPSCTVDWLYLARCQAVQNKPGEAAYAVREFQRQRPDENIAPQFAELAKGAPTAPPELSPQAQHDARPREPADSGF